LSATTERFHEHPRIPEKLLVVSCAVVARWLRSGTLWTLVLLVVACTPQPPAGFERHDDRYERCEARSKAIDTPDAVAFSGTVHDKLDATAVDGPIDLVLINGQGQPVKLQSSYPSTDADPSAERLATYDRIRASQRGDCVRISGSRMSDGRIWIDTFVKYDPDP